MPKLLLTVPETQESITRPVVLDIVRQILVDTGLPKSTTIFFPGDIDKGMQPNSSIEPDKPENITHYGDRIGITVDENYAVDRITTNNVYKPEHTYIFRDDALNISMKPVYSTTETVINFTYRAKSQTAATRWRDDFRAKVALMRYSRIKEINYHYLIPEEYLVILRELHRLRENVAGYGEGFITYVKNHFTPRLTEVVNLAGKQGAWAIAEKAIRVVGYFDISDSVPEKGSNDGEGDTWSITVAYKFEYEKPIACTMFYPLIVHNQLLDQKYRPSKRDYEIEYQNKRFSLTNEEYLEFQHDTNGIVPLEGVSIPDFDEFIPEFTVVNTQRVFTAMVTIDPANPRFLLSLRELGSVVIDPAILTFLVGEAPYIAKERQSVFHLSLYSGYDLYRDVVLTMDSDLNVFTTLDLSLRNQYHVRLGLSTSLSELNPKALDRLREHGLATHIVLETLGLCYPEGKSRGFIDTTGGVGAVNAQRIPPLTAAPYGIPRSCIPGLIGGRYIAKYPLSTAINQLDNIYIARGNQQNYSINTVGTLFVQAYRREDANRI